MKRTDIFLLFAVLLGFTGCELIGDIFKAGVWVGVLMVVGIIALIVFVLGKVFRK